MFTACQCGTVADWSMDIVPLPSHVERQQAGLCVSTAALPELWSRGQVYGCLSLPFPLGMVVLRWLWTF